MGRPFCVERVLAVAAAAAILSLLVVLGAGHGVGREELIDRELHLLEDLAGVAVAATAALLLRHAVVIHGDE